MPADLFMKGTFCIDLHNVKSQRAKHFYAFLMSLQALDTVQLKQEVTHIEEERIQVLNNIEELEQKIKDLDNQMEESVREVQSAAQYTEKKQCTELQT